MNGTHPLAGIAGVLAAAALWGTTGTAQAIAGGSLSPLWFGALRLLTASAFFIVFAALQPRPATRSPRLSMADLLGAGLCMAVYNLAFFAGIRGTGVALGTAIALGSGPVWAGALQALALRRPPNPAWWVGMAVAVAGGVLMTLGRGAQSAGFDAVGIGLCLLSGLAYAVYTLLTKRMLPAASAAVITRNAFGIAAALSLPAAWLVEGAPRLDAPAVAAVAYTGIVAAGIPYLLFSVALRHIAPATAVTLALCEPVVAFVLALTVLGETATPITVAGLALVVAGVVAVVRQELRAGVAPARGPLSAPVAEMER